MILVLKLSISMMHVLYFFCKLGKTKNKVLFVSRQSNTPPLEYQMIIEELKYVDCMHVVMCKTIEPGLTSKIKYCFWILGCMLHLATSKVCITDGYSIPVSVLRHKRDLKIIQLWHAIGAVKKFGYQIIGEQEGSEMNVAKTMKMHNNYDYVICSGIGSIDHFVAGFGIHPNQIQLIGMPRIDYILDGKETSIQEKIKSHLQLERDKTIILYVPTFRKGKTIPLEQLTEHISFDKYHLIVKLHPLDKTAISDSRIIEANQFHSWDLMQAADILLTDYSALSMEASLLEKKIYFWLYDDQEYFQNRGVNVDLWEAFPEYSYGDAKSLMEKIENGDYNLEYVRGYRDLYASAGAGATKRIRKLIQEAGNFLNKISEA